MPEVEICSLRNQGRLLFFEILGARSIHSLIAIV
jgi:hypothetical protein